MSMHALSALPNDREPLTHVAERRFLREAETRLLDVAGFLEDNDPDFDDRAVASELNEAIKKVEQAKNAIVRAREMVER